ncbi:MAG: hypothetical protein HY866_10715 [Chloroflexi bacterium]|nr:hypothetical protein [Chloroflexota bacterium]
MTERRAWWVLSGIVFALMCYYLPWFTHSTAGFTTNGFDLAEWTSLHPAVRSSSPAMLTSFLLRVPQWAMIAALALIANRFGDARVRWVLRGMAALLALRFFPPIDYFSNARNDPNYRQMMQLFVLSVIAVVTAIGLYRLPGRGQAGVLVAVLLAGIGSGWTGLSRASVLLDNFEIAVKIGPGFVGFIGLSAVLIMLTVWPRQREHKVGEAPSSLVTLLDTSGAK